MIREVLRDLQQYFTYIFKHDKSHLKYIILEDITDIDLQDEIFTQQPYSIQHYNVLHNFLSELKA
jgi:hypothetical protein